MLAVIPSDLTRSNKVSVSCFGGPKSASVPAISITQRKLLSSSRCSTLGEKVPAHSSNADLEEASYAFERVRIVTAGKVSISTFVMSRMIPIACAVEVREHTCCDGALPSITTHG